MQEMRRTKTTQANLIPLKQWRAEEATRTGMTLHAIEMRWLRGWYPEAKATCVELNHKTKLVDRRIGAVGASGGS